MYYRAKQAFVAVFFIKFLYLRPCMVNLQSLNCSIFIVSFRFFKIISYSSSMGFCFSSFVLEMGEKMRSKTLNFVFSFSIPSTLITELLNCCPTLSIYRSFQIIHCWITWLKHRSNTINKYFMLVKIRVWYLKDWLFSKYCRMFKTLLSTNNLSLLNPNPQIYRIKMHAQLGMQDLMSPKKP